MGLPEKSEHLKKTAKAKDVTEQRLPANLPASRRAYPEGACSMPAPSSKYQEPRSASKPPKISVTRDIHPTARSRRSSRPSSAGATKATYDNLQMASSKATEKPQQFIYEASHQTSESRPRSQVQLSQRDIEKIERETRGQQSNQDWHHWRQNRITASLAHQISHSRFANQKTSEIPQSYLKAVLGTGPKVQTAAMKWGIVNEKRAVQAYEEQVLKNKGREVQVEDCGLFIHPTKHWLASSPDGIVKDKKTGERLCTLEVKCPYKHREHTIHEACADRLFCLARNGEDYVLKPSHAYYTQVQCQLATTGMKHADFVVYTNKETVTVPVKFNPEFWQETEPKLEKFYKEAVVPQVKKQYTAGQSEKKTVYAPEE